MIHEDRVKVGGDTKAPDYCFTVYGQKKFFVEAGKPSVKIQEEVPPAYQVRRYGWSAKLAVSLITDFEEFAVYDCTKKPSPASVAANHDASETERIDRLIDATDREIDQLVYKLYGLTEEEIGIMEGK